MSEDQYGTDFSAVRAHATLEIHMKECSERQAELRAALLAIHGRLDAMNRSFDDRAAVQETSIDKRMTAISNRMWAAAAALITALAVVAFHFATKGH